MEGTKTNEGCYNGGGCPGVIETDSYVWGLWGSFSQIKKKKEFRHQMKHSWAYANLDYKLDLHLSSPKHKVLSINTLCVVNRKAGRDVYTCDSGLTLPWLNANNSPPLNRFQPTDNRQWVHKE